MSAEIGALDLQSLVKVTTASGRSFTGAVFTVDREQDLLVLEIPHPQSVLKKDVCMLSLSSVVSSEVVESAPEAKPVQLPLLSIEAAEERERAALASAEQALKRIGTDVTPEAQILFNTLCKTLDCRWDGKSIVELKLNVRIDPPYSPDHCVGDDESAVDRMKMIVRNLGF